MRTGSCLPASARKLRMNVTELGHMHGVGRCRRAVRVPQTGSFRAGGCPAFGGEPDGHRGICRQFSGRLQLGGQGTEQRVLWGVAWAFGIRNFWRQRWQTSKQWLPTKKGQRQVLCQRGLPTARAH